MQESRITASHNWLILSAGERGDKTLQLTDNANRVEISVYAGSTFIGKQLTPKEAYEVSVWLHEWANEHGYPADHGDTRSQITELHSEYSAEIATMQLRAEAAERAVAAMTRRAETAEARLALVERYGADQWRAGNAGRDPQEFAEWRREVQP